MVADTLGEKACAFWTVGPGKGELRQEDLKPPGPGEALVRTLHTGISRGTEMLVYNGQVPASVRDQMRSPFQEGDLPGPVKYGYLSVGLVEQGPSELEGRTVFCLYPHQDRFVAPADALVPVPDGVPARRAVLAGTMETAVNAVWEAGPRLGDRVAVIGAGMVGLLVAALLKQFPLGRLQLADIDPAKGSTAAAFGVDFVAPGEAADNCDIVIHCSASGEGLATGLGLLGVEGELIEMSWYGERAVQIPLGAEFHSRRLSIRASQVGAVAPVRRARRSNRDRLLLALELLKDPVFDALLTGTSNFDELPAVMERLASGELNALCHVIDYPGTAVPETNQQGE
ncbi:zinc-dependent alcohol dehydrogenase [Arthrobacter sp. H14]|uniref:zinc-dependent alcohol dehydrogenase n=1 Tax=Arthrobacter sp. H14 TaxID=1312959 RepID=UPI00047D791A|nr:zinc-binding alcohol dehydrogenase [Arthrobacter sp. H14]